jgi:hypothetical protein
LRLCAVCWLAGGLFAPSPCHRCAACR